MIIPSFLLSASVTTIETALGALFQRVFGSVEWAGIIGILIFIVIAMFMKVRWEAFIFILGMLAVTFAVSGLLPGWIISLGILAVGLIVAWAILDITRR